MHIMVDKFKINNKEKFQIFSTRCGAGRDFPNLDICFQHYVTDTAKVISRIDGTSIYAKWVPDYVIYLDKSGRPVSWLVDLFWNTLSSIPPIRHFYIKLDRLLWFEKCGCDLIADQSGNIVGQDGKLRHADIGDFDINKISCHDIAMLRALFLKDCKDINLEKSFYVDNVMQAESFLDGKKILIIDEVASTGATLRIAEKLFNKTFNNIQIDTLAFWHDTATSKISSNGALSSMGTTPVWYYHNKDDHTDYENTCGRGIGDIDYHKMEQNYINSQSTKNLIRLNSYEFLGAPFDLRLETNLLSIRIAFEMSLIYDNFINDKILFVPPSDYSLERKKSILNEQGINFGRYSQNSIVGIRRKMATEENYNIENKLADYEIKAGYDLITRNNKIGYLPA